MLDSLEDCLSSSDDGERRRALIAFLQSDQPLHNIRAARLLVHTFVGEVGRRAHEMLNAQLHMPAFVTHKECKDRVARANRWLDQLNLSAYASPTDTEPGRLYADKTSGGSPRVGIRVAKRDGSEARNLCRVQLPDLYFMPRATKPEPLTFGARVRAAQELREESSGQQTPGPTSGRR